MRPSRTHPRRGRGAATATSADTSTEQHVAGTLLVIRLTLLITALVLMAIGVPLAAAQLHVDRMRHTRDSDTGLHATPAKALSGWFWTGSAATVTGLALLATTWYVHYWRVVNHPEVIADRDRPRQPRPRREASGSASGSSWRSNFPKSPWRSRPKERSEDDEDAPLRPRRRTDSDSSDDGAGAPAPSASRPLLDRSRDDSSDDGIEMPSKRAEAKSVESDLSDSDDGRKPGAKPEYSRRTPAPAPGRERRRRDDDDSSLDS